MRWLRGKTLLKNYLEDKDKTIEELFDIRLLWNRSYIIAKK